MCGRKSPRCTVNLDFNPILNIVLSVRLIEGRHLEASWWWSRMRRPRACLASTHPGGAGAPPGGQQEPPARSLADGGRPSLGRPRKARPGAVRKTPANKPRLRKLVWVARRAAPRGLERDAGTQKQWLRHLARHPPRFGEEEKRENGKTGLPGASPNNTGDDACLLERLGCLKLAV